MSKQTVAALGYLNSYSPEVTSAYVDWLTAVYHDEYGQAGRAKMLTAPNRIVPGLGVEFEPKPTSWMGYSGYKVDHLFWGTREGEVCIRASGYLAAAAAEEIPVDGVHVSRLDLALTAWFTEDCPAMALAARRTALTAREDDKSPRRRKIRLQDGCGDGDTLYIGSRKSEMYGRLYDKWRESGDDAYKHAWRAEVEYHDDKATGMFKLLRGVRMAQGAIASTVTAWWRERGVDLPWYRGGDTPLAVRQPGRSPTDVKKLAWLASQVAPGLPGLVARVGRDVVESALWGHDVSRETTELNPNPDE